MKPTATLESVLRFVEEATQSPAGAVGASTRLTDLSGWDSLGIVLFMDLVRGTLGVQLSVNDVQPCATPVELAAAIARRQAPETV